MPTKKRLRDIALLARAGLPLVQREASRPLPDAPIARAEEGRRRLEVAGRELSQAAAEQVHCDPARAVSLAFEVIQAIYSLLKSLGVIGADGRHNNG
jgi:hypothetical protein